MAKNNDDLAAAILALGAIGIGIAGFAALSKWEQKKRFVEALTAALAEHGVGLVSAEVGRGSDDGPAWFVTVDHPWAGVGLQSYNAVFANGTDLYAAATLDRLIERLLEAMPARRPAWGTG